MKNSSRLFAKIAAKLARSMIGRSRLAVRGPLVELQPAQLAVEEAVVRQRLFAGLKLTLVVFIGLGDMLSYLAAQDRLRGCVKNLCHTFLLYP
ncbi:MAG: hypothetical protein ACLSUZ_03570 [Bifidobacterium pseudocatenulatum]